MDVKKLMEEYAYEKSVNQKLDVIKDEVISLLLSKQIITKPGSDIDRTPITIKQAKHILSMIEIEIDRGSVSQPLNIVLSKKK